jgi:glycerophosphoryl diester phosphodiesterase
LQAVAINPYFKKLDLEVAKQIHAAGFKIFTWTVNEPEDIDAMKKLAVDGIITNFPERVN